MTPVWLPRRRHRRILDSSTQAKGGASHDHLHPRSRRRWLASGRRRAGPVGLTILPSAFNAPPRRARRTGYWLSSTTPPGAAVRIDGANRGVTPAQLSLSPGHHNRLLRQAGSMDQVQHIELPSAGTALSVNLWLRQAVVLPIRAVYPGAGLLDALFVDNGKLGLNVNSGAGPGLAQPRESDELWELDPATGNLERQRPASGSGSEVSAVALSPDGQQAAYATGGQAMSSSLWPTISSVSHAEPTNLAAVRLVNRDGIADPLTVLQIDRKPASSGANAERIGDLIWTPDSQHLIVVTPDGHHPRARPRRSGQS